jgi:urease accessory protein
MAAAARPGFPSAPAPSPASVRIGYAVADGVSLATLDSDGTVSTGPVVEILADTLLPGRVARGEAHVYDFYWSETEVRRPDGTLLFADTLRLNPAAGDDPRSLGLLGPHDVIATLQVVSGRSDPETLVRQLRAVVGTSSNVLAGVSELPNGCGVSVRLLGASSKVVSVALRTVWNAARLALLGIPAPDLRKGVPP